MYPAASPLPIDIHWNRHQTRPDIDPANRYERLQHALVLEPRGDKVCECEDEDVLKAIDCRECFGRIVRVCVDDVTNHPTKRTEAGK